MLAHFDKYSKVVLGRFFRENRELKNITQTEMARSLSLASSQHISNVERGASNFTSDQIKKIVEILGLDMEVVEQILIREMIASFKRNWNGEVVDTE